MSCNATFLRDWEQLRQGGVLDQVPGDQPCNLEPFWASVSFFGGVGGYIYLDLSFSICKRGQFNRSNRG